MPCAPRMQTGCRANGPIDLRGNPLVSPVYHTRAQLSGTLSFCKHTCMGRDVTRELSLQVQRQSVNFSDITQSLRERFGYLLLRCDSGTM